MLNKDKLISAERLKQHFSWWDDDTMATKRDFIDIIEAQPAVDPKFSGQWLKYDALLEILRALAGEKADRGDKAAEEAIKEVADYFTFMSRTIAAAERTEVEKQR